jgi:hypothetical protein
MCFAARPSFEPFYRYRVYVKINVAYLLQLLFSCIPKVTVPHVAPGIKLIAPPLHTNEVQHHNITESTCTQVHGVKGDTMAEQHEMFQLTRVIGNGSFGEIFLARHSVSGEEVAAKVEMVRNRATKSQLRREAKIYKVLYGSGTDEHNLCRSTT